MAPSIIDNIKSMSTITIVIQIIVALIVVLILYILTLAVLNIDSIVVNNSVKVLPKQQTQIILGYAPVNYLAGRSFNPINPLSDNFKKMGKSINTRGGAQFTYQFWIKIEDTSNEALFKDLILLLKGDNRKYQLAKYHIKTSDADKNNYNLINVYDPEYLINCPMIKFGKSYRELKVYFNTSKGPATISSAVSTNNANSLLPNVHIKMSPDDDLSSRRNVLSLLPLNWYLFTFVFEDNYSLQNGSENGIRFTYYINDFPYQISSASTDMFLRNNMLKQNDGNLFVLPNFTDSSGKGTGGQFMKMGNLNYFNYALDAKDVKKTFEKGPPTFNAMEQDTGAKVPNYLSAYNKIDVYNY